MSMRWHFHWLGDVYKRLYCFFFQAEDGIRDRSPSRGLGDVYKRQVLPGDRLRLETRIIKRKGPVGVGEATASVDGKTVVTAELTFMVGE